MSKKLISKELMTEVLCWEHNAKNVKNEQLCVQTIHPYYDDNELRYKLSYVEYIPKGFEKTINIHELAYKCKLWALEAGFEITEEFDRVRVISLDRSRYIEDIPSNNYRVKAIFKACEWILKDTDAITK